MAKRKTREKFIEDARAIHGNKYDYSKVEYINNRKKVCIICPEHGEFLQKPYRHLEGRGCNFCAKPVHDTASFVQKARNVHGDKYDYSEVKYTDSMSKVRIICPIHGEFCQQPNNHLQGQGCPKCNGNTKLTTEEFIERAKKIHGNKYDYSKIEYKGEDVAVPIVCSIHGEFLQTPHNHLRGKGCKYCKESKLEIEVEKLLKENNIEFIRECKKDILEWLDRLSLDFYLPKHNIAIECQGRQHFEIDNFFGGNDAFLKQTNRDTEKAKKCIEYGVKLLYYTNPLFKAPYEVITNKDTLLKNILNENIA